MEEKYWDKFLVTGKIEDYLAYRDSSGKEEMRESDYSDRDGDFSIADR